MIRIIKNFLEESETKVLNNWCLNNYNKSFFTDPGMDIDHPGTRLTTRIHAGLPYSSENDKEKIGYPQEAFNIQKRIITTLQLKKPLFPRRYRHGIVNGIGFEFGSICSHVDPIYLPNTYTVHCNFLTQKSIGGGVTIINGKEYDIDVGDALIYTVSHLKHEVTQVIGKIPRILWCYGFCVTDEDIKNIFPYQNKVSKNA